MKKWTFLSGGILLLIMGITLTFSPDAFSLVIIGVMSLITLAGFSMGIVSAFGYADGFRTADKQISQSKRVYSNDAWASIQQIELFFQQKTLDRLFSEYKEDREYYIDQGTLLPDLYTTINEETLALRSWQNVINQIPGALTAIGLLGTFLGLIMGISSIAFSSVEAALSSISILLNGIETAFYTSIAGVVFSIAFNFIHKFSWNMMLREMGIFMENFHKYVIPDQEEQLQRKHQSDMEHILECLDKLPNRHAYFSMGGAEFETDDNNEPRLMSEIWEAMKNNEFIFYIQPICDLNTRQVVGGEALMRWDHKQLGIVSPAVFLPRLETNGYIVKLDRYLYEEVVRTIRNWLDMGINPVPISVNLSKTDILVMDVAEFFSSLLEKYQVPPKFIQLEIDEKAYFQIEEEVQEAEQALRQKGFTVIIDGYKGDYAAMSRFRESHADMLKLDIPYVEEQMEMNMETIRELFQRARESRVKVVASGIESVKQMTILRKAGCLEGQGYYLYKPMSVENFENQMKKS